MLVVLDTVTASDHVRSSARPVQFPPQEILARSRMHDALRRSAEQRRAGDIRILHDHFVADVELISVIDGNNHCGVRADDIAVCLTGALSDCVHRLNESPIEHIEVGELAQTHSPSGDRTLRLTKGFGDGFRRISEGWKNTMLRLREANLLCAEHETLSAGCVDVLKQQFLRLKQSACTVLRATHGGERGSGGN
eukprot:2900065-Rhodomonas_salina.1